MTVQTTTATQTAPPETDAQLVARFNASRDEAAFGALVQRYGPAVWQVCHRVLRDRHDAHDAFQATFLALLRGAAHVQRPEAIGSWLYGVAYRMAMRARVRRQRGAALLPETAAAESDVVDPLASDPLADVAQRELLRVLDEELMRLPARYREPLVLFYLAGQSRQAVAVALGLSETVVKGRLQRGRSELRMRMALRGASLSLAAAAIAVQAQAARAACNTAELTAAALEATRAVASGTSGTCEELVDIIRQEACSMSRWTEAIAVTSSCLALALGFAGLHLASAAPAAGEPSVAFAALLPPASRTAQTVSEPLAHLAQSRRLVTTSPASPEARTDGENPDVTLVASNHALAGESRGYHDGTPDGRKSIAGTGEMIQFTAPGETASLRGIRLHCARYGYPQPPKENVKIYLVGDDTSDILHTELVPYARFERGESKWVAIRFKKPVEVPERFWVIVDFNAEQTKGVYVSYDTSTKGQYSRTGLPGEEPREVTFGGDWMIEALFDSE